MEFVDGVTIIKKCTETSTMGNIMMILLLVITMALSFGAYKIGDDVYGRVGAVLSLAFLITGIFITLGVMPELDTFQKPTGKYEVTVNSNVDMNEFQSKYDIIDYDNGVYTVKPKDNVPKPPVNTHKETTEESTIEIDGKIYKITPIE